MSNQKRTYELRERARRQAETRQRIVEATVALHEEKGPAATTVAEIARRAGVSRLTVYNHFPSDGELFAACQRQYLARTPLPDLSRALALDDPDERLRAVLERLYRSYRRQKPMTGKVLRDRHVLPALDALLSTTLDRRQAQLGDALLEGFPADPRTRKRARAAVALALDFATWQRLTRDGLSDRDAAGLMAGLVLYAADGGT
jgi:AcrR family transcriptional regulator